MHKHIFCPKKQSKVQGTNWLEVPKLVHLIMFGWAAVCLHRALTGSCVWSYQLSKAEERLGGQECFIWAEQITTSDMGTSQEDWEVSSLDLRKPDKPSCPVLNSGLAVSWETLTSHDSCDQGLMSTEKSCLILRIALLIALHRRLPWRYSPINQSIIKSRKSSVKSLWLIFDCFWLISPTCSNVLNESRFNITGFCGCVLFCTVK